MNPFRVKVKDGKHIVKNRVVTKETYLKLWQEVKNRDYSQFLNQVQTHFKVKMSDELIEEIHTIALRTQVVVKTSRMMYLHGFVLYCALTAYLRDNRVTGPITILETGTARGFSSLCMCLALRDNKASAVIHTVDILPSKEPIYWNCIRDFEGPCTRAQLLAEWQPLVKKYVRYHSGKSKHILPKLGLKRIHFAFLDAAHTYDALAYELKFTKKHQQKGDTIVCDDYTIMNDDSYQFPGIIKAVDQCVCDHKQIFWGDDGAKKRGYVVLS